MSLDLMRLRQSDFLFAHSYSWKDSEEQHEEYVIRDNPFKIKTVLKYYYRTGFIHTNEEIMFVTILHHKYVYSPTILVAAGPDMARHFPR